MKHKKKIYPQSLSRFSKGRITTLENANPCTDDTQVPESQIRNNRRLLFNASVTIKVKKQLNETKNDRKRRIEHEVERNPSLHGAKEYELY